MRRLALPLLLALSALAFAPAPLPRPDRETPARKRERRLAECRRRLDELGVRWHLADREGRRAVRFSVLHPNGGGISGKIEVDGGDLVQILRAVIEQVESFFRNPDLF